MTKKDIEEIANFISTQIVLTQKKVLTLNEAAAYAGFSVSYLYKLTSQRRIPFAKPLGKNIFFQREELEQWLLRNRVSTLNELNQRARANLI